MLTPAGRHCHIDSLLINHYCSLNIFFSLPPHSFTHLHTPFPHFSLPDPLSKSRLQLTTSSLLVAENTYSTRPNRSEHALLKLTQRSLSVHLAIVQSSFRPSSGLIMASNAGAGRNPGRGGDRPPRGAGIDRPRGTSRWEWRDWNRQQQQRLLLIQAQEQCSGPVVNIFDP